MLLDLILNIPAFIIKNLFIIRILFLAYYLQENKP